MHPLLALHFAGNGTSPTLETCPGHPAHTVWQRAGCPLLWVSRTQGWGSLHGAGVCKQDHNRPAQFPQPLPLPRNNQHKKCEEIGLSPPHHQVICMGATWLDLISPGSMLCTSTHLPFPPQTTSAKVLQPGGEDHASAGTKMLTLHQQQGRKT